MEAKKDKERKATESALRKKELQECDKQIAYGAKLTEVCVVFLTTCHALSLRLGMWLGK